jgi:LysM repeat protein
MGEQQLRLQTRRFNAFLRQELGAALDDFQNRHAANLWAMGGVKKQQILIALELSRSASYCRVMKRVSLCMVIISLCAAPISRAQDAATEERLNKLSGLIEDLIAGQKAQQRQMSELAKEIDRVREQASKPTGNYASADDLRSLSDAVKEIDRKRMDDYEKIRGQLVKLGTTLAAPPPPSRKVDAQTDKPAPVAEKGIEYVVQPGDTLSDVVQACKDKKIKVTIDQIVKANPGLKPEKIRVGQKLFIPVAQP